MTIDIFMIQEAIASVSLSHEEECDCTICAAAQGSTRALAQVLEELQEGER